MTKNAPEVLYDLTVENAPSKHTQEPGTVNVLLFPC